MLKSSPQSNCPMIRPPAHASPALGCLHGSCCIGGAPWCSANPSPTPLLQGVVSEAPTTAADLRSVPWLLGRRLAPQTPRMHARPRLYPPWGGHPADSQTPHPTSHAGWRSSGSGSNCSLTPKEAPSLAPCTPLLLAKGPTCPPFPHTSLGCHFLPALSLPPNTQYYVFQL